MNRPRKILILDDEPGIRGAMATALNLHGHQSFPAASAQEALAIARSQEIDFVITDLRLDGADGVAALEQIRAIRPGIHAIVMTGYATLDSAVQALRLGAVDYLTKPFRVESVLRAIDGTAGAKEEGSAGFRSELPWRRQIALADLRAGDLLLEISLVMQNAGFSTATRKRALAAFGESLSNAARHAFPDGKGWIGAELCREGKFLCGRVSDSGRGFDSAVVVADAISKRNAQISGLRFLHQCADDVRIRASQGKGCVVEFRIEAEEGALPDRISLPPVPSGSRWSEALRYIQESPFDLRIDGTDLEFLTPNAARELQRAIHDGRRRERAVSLQGFHVSHPGMALLWSVSTDEKTVESADGDRQDESLVRKALWA